MALAGKKVVVIGGASGFGNAVARSALDAGAIVTITGRDEQRLQAAVDAFALAGHEASSLRLDAAETESLPALFETIGAFDHLVSMAGGAMGGGFLEAPFSTIRNAVEEKLFNNLAIARAAAPYTKAGGSLTFTAGSGGRPDNASGAIVGNEAIASLVRGLAVELAPKVRVNAVAPTWTPTPLWRNMQAADVDAIKVRFEEQIPLRRVADIQEVADVFLFLMKATFVTGQTISVDGGLSLL